MRAAIRTAVCISSSWYLLPAEIGILVELLSENCDPKNIFIPKVEKLG